MNYFKNLFKGISKPLLLLPMALAIISITMMFSTSYRNGIVFSREVLIQSFAYFLGFILIIIIANMDYSVFQDFEKLLYIGSLVLLLLVYIPFVGVEQFGARSWINLGFMYFQPSEVVKITFILLFANYLQKHRDSLYSFKEIMKAAIYCAPFIAIILKEDLGSALVFLAVWVTMVFYAGIDYRLFAHQKVRIEAFLHPSNLALEGNYQVYQSKIAIGSGGFFGKGLFQGTQKELEFLPVRNSDFIFSVIVEELGFIGGALVIGIYSWLVFVMAKVAMLCKDFYGSLIVMGIIGMFTFQIFENIAMTMGIMPVTGITLPFLSYGGSSIISNMIALGFVINVAIKNRGVIF
ncbi:MAG: FtsW/RodA/SpoVE family cell cycle protein [Anaerovoracaceae bacterium]